MMNRAKRRFSAANLNAALSLFERLYFWDWNDLYNDPAPRGGRERQYDACTGRKHFEVNVRRRNKSFSVIEYYFVGQLIHTGDPADNNLSIMRGDWPDEHQGTKNNCEKSKHFAITISKFKRQSVYVATGVLDHLSS
jgi:hypothetical protein